jgi:hypothetical protein
VALYILVGGEKDRRIAQPYQTWKVEDAFVVGLSMVYGIKTTFLLEEPAKIFNEDMTLNCIASTQRRLFQSLASGWTRVEL